MKVSENNFQYNVRIAEEARVKAEEDSKATRDDLMEHLRRTQQEIEALRGEKSSRKPSRSVANLQSWKRGG